MDRRKLQKHKTVVFYYDFLVSLLLCFNCCCVFFIVAYAFTIVCLLLRMITAPKDTVSNDHKEDEVHDRQDSGGFPNTTPWTNTIIHDCIPVLPRQNLVRKKERGWVSSVGRAPLCRAVVAQVYHSLFVWCAVHLSWPYRSNTNGHLFTTPRKFCKGAHYRLYKQFLNFNVDKFDTVNLTFKLTMTN